MPIPSYTGAPANTTGLATRHSYIGYCQISTANANYDGTGSMEVLADATAFPNGIRIDLFRFLGVGATVADKVKLFLQKRGASKAALWHDNVLTAVASPSASVAVQEGEYVPTLPLVLEFGDVLFAATHAGAKWNVFAHGGDFEQDP